MLFSKFKMEKRLVNKNVKEMENFAKELKSTIRDRFSLLMQIQNPRKTKRRKKKRKPFQAINFVNTYI